MKKLTILVGVIISMIFTFSVLSKEPEETTQELNVKHDWLQAQIDKVHLERDEFYLYRNGEIWSEEIEYTKGRNIYIFEEGVETKRGVLTGNTVKKLAESYAGIPYFLIDPHTKCFVPDVVDDCYKFAEKVEEYKQYEPYYILFSSTLKDEEYISFEDHRKRINAKKSNNSDDILYSSFHLMFYVENGIITEINCDYRDY